MFRSQDMDLSRRIISCIGIENATQHWWPTAKHAKECHGTSGLDYADRRSVGKAPLSRMRRDGGRKRTRR